MNEITYCVVDKFPEPAFHELAQAAFADYEPSDLLAKVLKEEAAAKPQNVEAAIDGALRIGAFRGDTLIGWTYARPEGANQFHMINSGVAAAEQRHGVYSTLVQMVIAHATSQGYVAVVSRHAANNNAVIVAKLKLGFVVSGFEYSEVYGPLVRLTLLLGELRRALHRSRASPIRIHDASDG